MRFSTTINNIKAIEWGLNIQQAYLFSWFYELPSWAKKVVIDNDIYYFASKNKAIEELPILTDKPDTMYRYYKQLEDLDLIFVKKIDGKDYIALTFKAKEWNLFKSEYSEINPRVLGNKSENNSEINPTNNNTISNNNTNDKLLLFTDEKIEKFDFKKSLFKEGAKENLIDDWCKVRKTKSATNTETALKKFLNQVFESGKGINEILTICIENDWKGFNAEWIKNKKTNPNGEPVTTDTGKKPYEFTIAGLEETLARKT